jgi:hypothetical protein
MYVHKHKGWWGAAISDRAETWHRPATTGRPIGVRRTCLHRWEAHAGGVLHYVELCGGRPLAPRERRRHCDTTASIRQPARRGASPAGSCLRPVKYRRDERCASPPSTRRDVTIQGLYATARSALLASAARHPVRGLGHCVRDGPRQSSPPSDEGKKRREASTRCLSERIPRASARGAPLRSPRQPGASSCTAAAAAASARRRARSSPRQTACTTPPS